MFKSPSKIIQKVDLEKRNKKHKEALDEIKNGSATLGEKSEENKGNTSTSQYGSKGNLSMAPSKSQ